MERELEHAAIMLTEGKKRIKEEGYVKNILNEEFLRGLNQSMFDRMRNQKGVFHAQKMIIHPFKSRVLWHRQAGPMYKNFVTLIKNGKTYVLDFFVGEPMEEKVYWGSAYDAIMGVSKKIIPNHGDHPTNPNLRRMLR